MFGNFNEEARKILITAKEEMHDLRHPYVGSEHLLLAILKNDNVVSQKLKLYDFTYSKFKNEIIEIIGVGEKVSEWFLYTPLLKRVLENATINSKETNSMVDVTELFVSLLEEGEGVAVRTMIGMNVDLDELYSEFKNRFVNTSKSKKKKKLIIDDIGIDLVKKAKNNELDPVIGRDKEIKMLLEVICRRLKNNPILIGEAGVGKTAIVEELSRLISQGDVPNCLKNKTIISLNMASLVAGTKYRGEFEERISKLIKEVEDNDDIILFIDEIHTIVGAGGAEGAIDASNIFKPALSRGKIRVIGATTTAEYKKFISKDKALERRFQKIMVEAPSINSVKQILLSLKPIYENFHRVTMSDEIIDTIIDLSEKYIYDRNQPDKSIDIMDEVCSKVSLKETKSLKKYNDLKKEFKLLNDKKNEAIIKSEFSLASKYKEEENKIMNDINDIELDLYKNKYTTVTKKDVADVVSLKSGIPVLSIFNDTKKLVNNFSNNLNKKVVGQDKAIKEVINLYKKIRLGFSDLRCYSFLFVGPSGVGKTMLAKLFGDAISNNHVIKLDMSEYSEAHSVSKIVGAPPGYVGYDDNLNIADVIKNNPYSVLILDEVEKAHPKVINLFYQILDEGKLKNSSGEEIRFDNVNIIMTSNIGFDDIHVGFNKKNNDIVLEKLNSYFSVSFINRIDNIIVFNHLKKDEIIKLIDTKINSIKNKYSSKIKIVISKNVYNEIVDLSNYMEYGARKLDKIIKVKIENIIIDDILENKKISKISSIKENSVV